MFIDPLLPFAFFALIMCASRSLWLALCRSTVARWAKVASAPQVTRQCSYHHMGHRDFAIGGCAFESLPEGGPNLDADIRLLLGFGI